MVTTAVSRQQLIPSDDGPTMKKDRKRFDVENEILERQVLICKAFANSTRLHILDLLGKRDWSAAEIQQELGISKANLSQHAMVLRSAGVVVRRREGKQVYFSLAMPEVKKACQLIQHVLRAQIRNGQRLV
ncbi:MAG: metalloregulator ArsR/SmtB family transcription factor [Acidobacteriia bacterium]|nr:metalloregulator ArsR/SmtB family transcription factor [Terriglobia bacterium]